ncbi:MAG: sulfite exporter TauE/SafE family protein [Rhizobiaceae bacterium]|nr:sulfite exporter TauE/SafE family protein [Rhizobiaceae bacterium]
MLTDLINAGYWPDILSNTAAITLIISSMFTSAITVSFGLGGGVIMLALLVNFVPIAVVIPIHAVIQMGSNTSRAVLLRKHIVKPILIYFFLGAIVGAAIGGHFVVALPENILLGILGLFILYTTWGPKPKNLKLGKIGYVISGVFITFATMFIGATGPLAMALLPRKNLEKLQVSATHGSLLVVQHGLKILIFGFLGFAFKAWALFFVLMIVSGFIGTYSGRAVLQRMPSKYFQTGITIILTLMAIRMLYTAVASFL